MTHTDKELLEWAAKAADLQEWGWMADTLTHVVDDRFVFWRPLEDDGDALRLAVDLGIHITNSTTDALASTMLFDAIVPFGADAGAATRRAITAVAAEIGRKA